MSLPIMKIPESVALQVACCAPRSLLGASHFADHSMRTSVDPPLPALAIDDPELVAARTYRLRAAVGQGVLTMECPYIHRWNYTVNPLWIIPTVGTLTLINFPEKPASSHTLVITVRADYLYPRSSASPFCKRRCISHAVCSLLLGIHLAWLREREWMARKASCLRAIFTLET